MKKQFLAVLLTLAMLLSILPASALAAEGGEDGEAPVVYTETGEDPEGNPTDIPDEPDEGPAEGVGDPTVTDPEQEEPAEEPTAVEQLQARINDLSDADALAGMDKDKQAEVYAEVNDIYVAIEKLTTEEAEALDTAKLEATAAFFAQQIMPLGADDDEETVTPTSGICGAPTEEGGKVTDAVKWNFDNATGTLTISGSGEMADYTHQGEPWFPLQESITSAEIKNGVTSIGERAFSNCKSLKAVSLPNSLTKIGNFAFFGCEALTSVTIPASVTEVGTNPFRECAGLKEIILEGNNTAVKKDGSALLSSDGKTLISYPASSEGTSYTVPSTVETIQNGAFRYAQLTSISFDSAAGVKELGDWCFAGSTLTSITIPSTVTTMGINLFQNCTSLTSVTFENSPTVIPNYTFYGCTSLSSFEIPDTVTTIGTEAFRLTGLTDVTIPKSVTTMGRRAYAYNNISTFQVLGTLTEAPEIFTGSTVGVLSFQNSDTLSIPANIITYSTKVTAIDTTAYSGKIGFNTGNGQNGGANCLTGASNTIFYSQSAVTQYIGNNANVIWAVTNGAKLDVDNILTANGEFADVTIEDGYQYDGWTDADGNIVKKGTGGNTYSASYYPLSGTADGIKWEFDQDTGTLTISANEGTENSGKMTAYTKTTSTNAPWYPFRSQIKNIVIGDDVTYLGAYAFYNYTALEYVEIKGDLDSTNYGKFVFSGCSPTVIAITSKNLYLTSSLFEELAGLKVLDLSTHSGSLGINSGTGKVGAANALVGVPKNTCIIVSDGVTVSNWGTNKDVLWVNVGTEVSDLTILTDEDTTGLSTIVRDGYSVKWYKDASKTQELEDLSTASGETNGSGAPTVYYAEWLSTITFNANGGSGTMEAQTIAETDTSTTLSENTFTRTNYTFSGWNTAADGSGTSYADQATGAGANGNITLYAQWTMKIGESTNYTVNAIVDQIYTGSAITPTVVVKNSSTGDVIASSQYSVSYADNINVGTAKATVTKDENTAEVEFKIIKDEKPTIEMADVSVTYGTEYAMTATAKTSAGNEITDGTITIKYYTDESCSEGETSAAPTNAGTYYAKATLTGTDNYAEVTKTAKITINKANFEVSAKGYSGTYNGLPHSITVTADGADVTYRKAEDSDYTSDKPEYTDAGVYTVYYKAAKANHEDVIDSLTVEITKATLTATYVSETINVGGTPKLDVTVAGFVNGETADNAADYKAPTVTNSNTAVGKYELKPADGSAKNYQFAYVAGTLTIRSSGNGGGGGSSSGGSTTYTVTVDSGKNGTVSVSPKNASKGATVTITVKPNSGYELDDLTVTDKNGDTVRVKDQGNGKYTFTMPASKVTVEASFTKIEEQPSVTFADVPTSAYYYDAVAWAVENGITSGTTATTFSPNAACTRAQTVTFLWRAAGSPAPKSSANPFTDVQPGAYYYDAVLWAVEQGITTGTTATTFSPNATVTRGQTVTFLHRAAGTAVAGSNPFTDVADSAYYAGAVKWAVAEGITSGTSATTFSPNQVCTRAQIVTFLYRAYA